MPTSQRRKHDSANANNGIRILARLSAYTNECNNATTDLERLFYHLELGPDDTRAYTYSLSLSLSPSSFRTCAGIERKETERGKEISCAFCLDPSLHSLNTRVRFKNIGRPELNTHALIWFAMIEKKYISRIRIPDNESSRSSGEYQCKYRDRATMLLYYGCVRSRKKRLGIYVRGTRKNNYTASLANYNWILRASSSHSVLKRVSIPYARGACLPSLDKTRIWCEKNARMKRNDFLFDEQWQ